MFLYFTGLMFLVGAELNSELVHRRLVRASTRDAKAKASAPPPPPPPPAPKPATVPDTEP